LYGSVFFLGRLTGNVILAHLGDSIGRIQLMRLSQAVTLVSYVTIVFLTRDPLVLYGPIFLIGLVSCWRCSLSYIYGQEIINSKFQNIVGSMYQVCDCSTLLISTIFYMKVSNYWVYLHSVFLALIAFSFLVFCSIPESPKFLAQSNKRNEEAARAYRFIARVNGVELGEEWFEGR
jgi:MFS family permease